MTVEKIVKEIWPKYEYLNFGEVQRIAKAMQHAMADELRKVQTEKIRKAGEKKP